MGLENGQKSQISTIAVVDLETSNLPAFNNNRVGITEICIYAFDPVILNDNYVSEIPQPADEWTPTSPNKLPLPPRVMHKLNLLFRPSMAIHPGAEEITGLNNYLLERESQLDENAAQMITRFFEHLPAPVCLVAHNGWGFDFPILKQAFDKLNQSLPESLRCVDSLRAFMEIDDRHTDEIYENPEPVMLLNLETELKTEAAVKLEPDLPTCSLNVKLIPKAIDWQKLNETTPKRPTLPRAEAAAKRKHLADGTGDMFNGDVPAKRKPLDLNARRQLFAGLKCAQTKRYPPRGCYRLGHLFECKFKLKALGAHQAEADVVMLTKLIQHYGVDFLAFAEEQAIPFADIVPLGGKVPTNFK